MADAKMKGAVAVVTGGGSGIGRALSLELAKRGAFVHVTDVNGPSAEATAKEIGAEATSAALDVRDAAAVQALCDSIGRVDYMFNNAGIPIGGEVSDLSLAHWDRIIDVNIRGVVHGIQAVYPGMVARGSGHIVNTASLAGLIPTPLGVPYGMTKHAIVGLSASLRMEAAIYGVRVSALCPAAVETPILDAKMPEGLPVPKWMPNARKLLTQTAKAYPVDKLASETLDAVAANVGLIVIPASARAIWRGYRLAPWVADSVGVKVLASARRSKPG